MADPNRSRPVRTVRARGSTFIPVLALAGVVLALSGAQPAGPPAHAPLERVQVPPDFTHADHESVQCFTCHGTDVQHGTLLVTTIQDCRACHHSAPLSESCSDCHTAADAPAENFGVVRTVSFSVGTGDAARSMTFVHDPHAAIDCARCHTQGTALAVAASLDCAGCHEDHHTATSDCASCHVAAPVSAHPPAEAHVTCSGSACHQRVPFESVPRTREFCLGCHQTMREHEAPRACEECHSLPAPRPQAGGVE